MIFSPFCGATTVTGGAVFDAKIGVGVGVDLLDASAIARCARRAEPGRHAPLQRVQLRERGLTEPVGFLQSTFS